jgi:DNA-binding transcriptional ArsR family regulator
MRRVREVTDSEAAMWKIHLTSTDLARTQVALGVNPLWEIALSLRILRDRTARDFARWRRQAGRDLHRAGLTTTVAEVLFPLIGLDGPVPGSLAPVEGLLGLEAGLDAVGGTLADALRGYHRVALAPCLDAIHTQVDAAVGLAARALREGGPTNLLGQLGPHLRWQPPILTLDVAGAGELRGDGRGLLLQPSYFCHEHPVPPSYQATPVTVVYPIDHSGPEPRAMSRRTELAALVGSTRAAVLHAVLDAPTITTGELAHRLGLSAATVSRHLTVLRETGLISSRRRANSVHHASTRSAAVLLRGRPDAYPHRRDG